MRSVKVWTEKGWKLSKHGNDYKQDGMWLFTIFKRGGQGCKLYIKNVPTGEEVYESHILYTTMEARELAFKFLYGRHVTKETQEST